MMGDVHESGEIVNEKIVSCAGAGGSQPAPKIGGKNLSDDTFGMPGIGVETLDSPHVRSSMSTESASMVSFSDDEAIQPILDAVSQGGRVAILNALRKAIHQPDATAAALNMLRTLSLKNDEGQLFVFDASEILFVVEAMKRHPGDAAVLNGGLCLIKEMADGGGIVTTISPEQALAPFRQEEMQETSHNNEYVQVVVAILEGDMGRSREDVAEMASRSLWSLVNSQPINKGLAGKLGAVQALLAVMRAHPGSAVVQEAAIRTLWSLSYNPYNSAKIFEYGGIETIASSLFDHASSGEVAKFALSALSNLSRSGGAEVMSAAAMWKDGSGVEKIMEILRTCSDATTVGKGWEVLVWVMFAAGCVKLVVYKGGIEMAIRAMRQYTKYPDTQMACISAIHGFVSADAELRCQVCRAGGLGSVASAMLLHTRHESIQAMGCSLMRYMSCDDANLVAFTDHGGFDAVFGALQIFPDNQDVQEKGIWNLVNISGLEKCEAILTIIEKGGVEVAINALSMHAMESRVVEQAVVLLMNLVINEESQGIAQMRVQNAPNGILRIVHAMKGHAKNSLIQEGCITVLCKLSIHPQTCILVGEAGGVGALVEAVRVHSSDENIVDKGAFTLAMVTLQVENQSLVVQEGGIELVMDLMHAYENSQGIVISAFVTMGNLGFAPETRGTVRAAGALRSMFKVMEKHTADVQIMSAGLQALTNLTVDNNDNSREVLGWGVRYVLSAMRSFPGNEKLMRGARGTLVNLASMGDVENQYIKDEAKAMGIKLSKTKSTSCKQQ